MTDAMNGCFVAERSVLGAVLINPELYASAALRPQDFAGRAHRVIWESMGRLEEARRLIDPVAVVEDLKRRGELQAVGGEEGLGALMTGMPRVTNADSWAEIVRDHARLRTVQAAAERMLALSKQADATAHDVLETGMGLLSDAAQRVGGAVDLDYKAGLRDAVAEMERSTSGEAPGLGTGVSALDCRIGPLRPGQLVIVAGQTGTGKSTLVTNVGDAVCAQGGTVLLFSAEMSRREINKRRLVAQAAVPASHFERGGVTPTERDWAAVAHAELALASRQFVIEASAPSPLEMRAKARFVKAALGLDLVVVDYLQLMNPGPGRKGENREQEVARVSRALKRMAMDLEVVVVAAAQLNRNAEARKDARPRLSDLRESGSQEQDSDVVLLLHQPSEDSDEVEIIVGKHRQRGPGKARVVFNGLLHRFEDLGATEWRA